MNPPVVSQGPNQDMIFIMLNNHQVFDPNTGRGEKEPKFSRQNPPLVFLFGFAIIQIVHSPCSMTEPDKVFLNIYILIS